MRNPTDTTLRNTRAANKKLDNHERRLKELEAYCKEIEALHKWLLSGKSHQDFIRKRAGLKPERRRNSK